MYSLVSFSSLILIFFLRRARNPTRTEAFFAIIFATYLLSVFSIQSLFSSWTQGSNFLQLASADSERYISEAYNFRYVFFINELAGTYFDGQNYYQATPKFGLSALLSPFARISSDQNFLHAVLLAVSFVLGLWKIRLIRNLSQTEGVFFGAVIVIVFFPTDLYWYFRFLREPIANSLLEISLLLILLIKRQDQPSRISQISLFFVIVLLLAWRSQLALFSCIAAVFIFSPKPTTLVAFLLLIIVSLYQSVLAAGFGILYLLPVDGAMRELLFDVMSWLHVNRWSVNIIIISSFLFFFWGKFSVSDFRLGRLILFIFCIAPLPYLYSEASQIRFLYPVFIFSKVFFVFLFIMQDNKKSRKIIHRRFNRI